MHHFPFFNEGEHYIVYHHSIQNTNRNHNLHNLHSWINKLVRELDVMLPSHTCCLLCVRKLVIQWQVEAGSVSWVSLWRTSRMAALNAELKVHTQDPCVPHGTGPFSHSSLKNDTVSSVMFLSHYGHMVKLKQFLSKVITVTYFTSQSRTKEKKYLAADSTFHQKILTA